MLHISRSFHSSSPFKKASLHANVHNTFFSAFLRLLRILYHKFTRSSSKCSTFLGRFTPQTLSRKLLYTQTFIILSFRPFSACCGYYTINLRGVPPKPSVLSVALPHEALRIYPRLCLTVRLFFFRFSLFYRNTIPEALMPLFICFLCKYKKQPRLFGGCFFLNIIYAA